MVPRRLNFSYFFFYLFFFMSTLLMMATTTNAQLDFKKNQLTFPRVRDAYNSNWVNFQAQLKAANLKTGFQLYFAAYKSEGILEIWAKNKQDSQYKLFKTYSFCKHSGTLGPKVQEGDYQTPEGIYYINVFNPSSNFLLSLGLNYPNDVDLARSGNKKPGNDIYIHGNCVTVGCIPITDEKIKEVYVLAVEAKNSGQEQIPVHVFPFKMTKANLDKYVVQFPQHKAFWSSIQPAYQYFEKHKSLPQYTEKDGKYMFK